MNIAAFALLAFVSVPTVAAVPAVTGDVGSVARMSQSIQSVPVEILIYTGTEDGPRRALPHGDAAFAEMRRVMALLDESAPETAIARLNAHAGDEPVALDPETFAVLDEMLRVARLTKGAFDPTIAPVLRLWPFQDSAEKRRVPTRSELEAAKALVDFEQLHLDHVRQTARLGVVGARIALGAARRAAALERAAAVLQDRGLNDFLIRAGGDMVVRGSKGGTPWMVGLQDPRAQGHFGAIQGRDGAVVTTHDNESFFLEGKKRFHSVLDPRTGTPASAMRSVTVFGTRAIFAQAVSVALFVLGPTEAKLLLERLKDTDAVMVTSDNRVLVSTRLRDVVQFRPPTDAP